MEEFPILIDDILSEENDGSKKLTRIIMSAVGSDPQKGEIQVKFSDLSQKENSDEYPISYSVISDDKDWAFVTASTIDERISKIKSGGLAQFTSKSNFRALSMSLVAMLAMIVMTHYGTPNLVKHRENLDKIK